MDPIERTIMSIRKHAPANQSGFTLVETMMALLILTGGLLALAAGFAQGLLLASGTNDHQIAKEKASEAMEAVFTSRDAKKIPNWNMIQNKSMSPIGIFNDGPRAILNAGADGLVNTDDDGDPEVLPGPDGRLGTTDDRTMNSFTREIEIRDIRANLRRIRVIVRYTVGGRVRQYQLVSYISPWA
jgi:prepilin-type N-terminal cleavage/methylation domain-containing protein